MIFEIILIVLIVLVLVLGYTSWIQMVKVESYEEQIEKQSVWLDEFINRIDIMSKTLKEIDSKGTFEADDEVGTFFESLKALQERIETFIGETTDGSQEEKEKE